MGQWPENFQLITYCTEHAALEIADCVECSEHLEIEPTLSPALGAPLRTLPTATESRPDLARKTVLGDGIDDVGHWLFLPDAVRLEAPEELIEWFERELEAIEQVEREKGGKR